MKDFKKKINKMIKNLIEYTKDDGDSEDIEFTLENIKDSVIRHYNKGSWSAVSSSLGDIEEFLSDFGYSPKEISDTKGGDILDEVLDFSLGEERKIKKQRKSQKSKKEFLKTKMKSPYSDSDAQIGSVESQARKKKDKSVLDKIKSLWQRFRKKNDKTASSESYQKCRKMLIKFAYDNPQYREELLPMLKNSSQEDPLFMEVQKVINVMEEMYNLQQLTLQRYEAYREIVSLYESVIKQTPAVSQREIEDSKKSLLTTNFRSLSPRERQHLERQFLDSNLGVQLESSKNVYEKKISQLKKEEKKILGSLRRR